MAPLLPLGSWGTSWAAKPNMAHFRGPETWHDGERSSWRGVELRLEVSAEAQLCLLLPTHPIQGVHTDMLSHEG